MELEEKLLNIKDAQGNPEAMNDVFFNFQPNERHRHRRNEDESDDESYDEEDDGYTRMQAPAPSDPDEEDEFDLRMGLVRKKGNTGPKAVLQDYKEAKMRAKVRLLEEKEQKLLAIQKAAMTAQSYSQEEAERRLMEKYSEELEDYCDMDDERTFEKYKQQRFREMMAKKQAAARPQYGTLLDVSGISYMAEIDEAPPESMVIIHIYENTIPACKHLNIVFEELAQMYPYVKFMKITNSQAGGEIPHYHLPGIIVYKHGKVFHSIIPATNYLGFAFQTLQVERLFQEFGIFRPQDQSEVLHSQRQFDESESDEDD